MSGLLQSAVWLLGIGSAAIGFTLLDVCIEALLVRLRHQRVAHRKEMARVRIDLLAVSFPDLSAYLIALMVAILIFFALGDSFLRFAAVVVLLAPHSVRRWLEYNRRQTLAAEVRALLMDLRLELAGGGGTLLAALRVVEVSGPPMLSTLLRGYLSGYTGSGLVILEWMAEDTQDEFLRDLTVRASAALAGGLSMDAAVQQSLARIVEEANTRLREELQRSPSRLTLVAIPLLLGPIFILWVIPLGAKILAGFSGDGSSIGGY
jgi:hypothetical protein